MEYTNEQLREIQQRVAQGRSCPPAASTLATSATIRELAGGLTSLERQRPIRRTRPEQVRYDHADIPQRYRQWTLADYADEIQQPINAWLDSAQWSLYLCGAVGTCKSSIAAAVVQTWRARYNPPHDRTACLYSTMETATKLFRNLATWFIERAQQWPLVVLDDLGATRWTDHVQECLHTILRPRYDNGRKTLLTSNLSLHELRQADERLADRLSEGLILPVGRKSIRGR